MVAIRKPFTQKKVGIEFKDKSRTKQSHKDECDINRIMAKYQKTGAIDHSAKHDASYVAVTGNDFLDMMNTVASANSMFEELPSSIRKRFDNNTALFLDYVQNPNNREDMIAMGIDDSHLPPAPPVENVVPPTTEDVDREV